MSALATLHELSTGCASSWDLYLRTCGLDLDVTATEWGETAESIELAVHDTAGVAWAAAQRSLWCWMLSANRELSNAPFIAGGPHDEADAQRAVDFLTQGIQEPHEDLSQFSAHALRKRWVHLELLRRMADRLPGEGLREVVDELSQARRELVRRGLFPVVLHHPDEHHGETRVAIDCRQPSAIGGSADFRSTAREWTAYLSQPRGIIHLDFPARLPKSVFNALVNQPQLLSLAMQWSDIDDLSALRALPLLRRLVLDTGVPARDVSPLVSLTNLEHLTLGVRRQVTDFSPLEHVTRLETLTLRTEGVADSLDFVKNLSSLRRFEFWGRVKGKNYDALLERPDLEWVRLRPVPGMTPTMAELRAALPGLVIT